MIVIIDYGMGNLHSVSKAFEISGEEILVSNKKEDIKKADAIVLPGVGAFGEGIANLKKYDLIKTLNEEVLDKKKPFLGICLGMQLLAKESEEFGNHSGLGWIPANIRKFSFDDKSCRIPHVGWSDIIIKKENPLLRDLGNYPTFYFVHSYYMACEDSNNVIAECDYGGLFTAAVQKDNIFGTQFHPEKSQDGGLKIIENFVNYIKGN